MQDFEKDFENQVLGQTATKVRKPRAPKATNGRAKKVKTPSPKATKMKMANGQSKLNGSQWASK